MVVSDRPEIPSDGAHVPGRCLSSSEIDALVQGWVPRAGLQGARLLVIVPDGTRSGPVDQVFRALFDACEGVVNRLDVMVALGTHRPMADQAICARLGISGDERRGRFAGIELINHAWDDPAALVQIGSLAAEEIRALSNGLFEMDVPIEVNRRLFDYDHLLIIGPVFPHEVVGFSGGNKYLFPGVAGPRILNFFHWLGAVVTNPRIIGNALTPVRKVVDRAAAMLTVPRSCLALVVEGAAPVGKGAAAKGAAGLFAGTPEAAWAAAADLSRALHVVEMPHPFHTIVSCLPPMYEDLWTGGKGMYKLEPVLADGGELVIFAPHIREVSSVHGRTLLEIGYHCRDYFLGQWERFRHHPWGVLAHSTHVRGIGSFEAGVERCRVQVTLATGIPADTCARIGLGYRDPASLEPASFGNREAEGVLLVPNAGEQLFRLREPPDWARA